jgi:hypothetical protein
MLRWVKSCSQHGRRCAPAVDALPAPAGCSVDAIDYVAPLPLRAAMLAIIAATGVSVSWAFQALLGDATWAISTGECRRQSAPLSQT